MKNRNIDQEVQIQVFQYLYYLEKMDDYNHQKGEQIVQKLSPQLQQQIKKNFYYPFLLKTKILKLNFHEQMLINATLKMKELTFGPGQVIFDQNDCDNRIYYILKGEVQLSSLNFKLSVKDETDNCFGISEFFSGEVRTYSAKSKTVTQIVYLEMNEFKQILKEEDPLEYEKFCSLKEQIIQTKLVADQSCFFCRKYNHIYELCPYYTIKHKKAVILEKSKVSIPQMRRELDRGRRDKFKCILKLHDVRIHLKAVRLNYINNSIIDKDSMIQLIESTLVYERDIDFYRNYEAFELRLKEDGQTFYPHLINYDKIAEEFFCIEEDEMLDNQSEVRDSPQNLSSPSKPRQSQGFNYLNQTSQSSQPTHPLPSIDEFGQKQSSLSTLAQYFYKKSSVSSQLTQTINANSSSQNSNSNIHAGLQNDKYSMFKQNTYQTRKTSIKIPSNGVRLSNQLASNPSIGSQQKLMDDVVLKNALYQMIKSSFQIGNEGAKQENQVIRESGFFGIDDLDEMKEYQRYFPQFNFPQVLSSHTKYNIKMNKGVFKKKRRSVQKGESNFSPNKARNRGISKQQKQVPQIDSNNDLQLQQLSLGQHIKENDQYNEAQQKHLQNNTNLKECPNIIGLTSSGVSENGSKIFQKYQDSPKKYNEFTKQSHFKPQSEDVISPSKQGNFSFY